MPSPVKYKDGQNAVVDIAADAVSGLGAVQIVKQAFGVDGAATVVSAGTPLPVAVSGVATESTLAAMNAKFRSNASGTLMVGTSRAKFRDAFLTFDTTNTWFPATTGTGQAVTVAGSTGGSRYLNIASGTTANAETLIISRLTFNAPCSVIVGFSMSQRIANCDAFIELVEVDSNGDVVTDATIASAIVKNAANVAAFRFTGTTATSQTVIVRQDGLSEESAALTFVTTAATGTNPNFIPAGQFEITLRTRDVAFSSLTVNAVAAKVAPSGALRNTRVPNPDATYALRIRVLNGATPPASSTDVRIHSVTVLDDTRVTVDFGSIAGVALPQNSAPVQVTNTITSTVSGTVTANQGTLVAPTASIVNSAASTNGTVVKASAGTLYSITASNTNAAIRYVKLYNSATVTVGTTAVALTIPIPAGGTVHIPFGATGMRFGTGICLSTTTGAADNDTGAVAAGEIKVLTSFI